MTSNREQFEAIGQRLDTVDLRLETIESGLGIRSQPNRRIPAVFEFIWKHKATVLPTAAIAVAIVGWFASGWFKYYLDHKDDGLNAAIEKELQKPQGVIDKLNTIKQTTDELKTTLGTLQPFIHDVIQHQFENVAKLPTGDLIPRIPALRNLVAVAENQNVTVDPHIVTEVGRKLVDASRQNAEAWDAVLRWVEYKSFNNNTSSLLPDTTNLAVFRDKYVINVPNGAAAPTFSLKGSAPADIAAQSGYIGEDRNKGMTSGPAWIVADGGDVGLDGMQLRNVVFRNVRISYFGAPLRMKNVYFVDCTFDMKVDQNTRQLAVALLAPVPSTSFQGGQLKLSQPAS
jgi:hypothetical protein